MDMTPKSGCGARAGAATRRPHPHAVNYTERTGVATAADFGVAVANLPAFLGNHLVRVDSPQRRAERRRQGTL